MNLDAAIENFGNDAPNPLVADHEQGVHECDVAGAPPGHQFFHFIDDSRCRERTVGVPIGPVVAENAFEGTASAADHRHLWQKGTVVRLSDVLVEWEQVPRRRRQFVEVGDQSTTRRQSNGSVAAIGDALN